MQPYLLLALCFLLPSMLMPTPALAANRTFTGPGNFSDATKWDGGTTLPTTGDNLTIIGTCTFDNSASNLAYGSLTLGSGSSGTIAWPSGGTNTLNVTAISAAVASSAIDMTNGGTLQVRTSWTTTNLTFTRGAGAINWNVTGAGSTLPSAITAYNNLTITSTGQTTNLGVGTTIDGTLTVDSGTLTVGALAITVTGAATVNSTMTTTSNTGDKTFNGALVVNGTLSLGPTTLIVNGATTVNGALTITSGTGTKTFNGNVTINSGGTLSETTAEPIAYAGDVTINTGGTLTEFGSATMTFAGSFQNDGTYTPTTGAHTFSGSGKTFSGASGISLANLALSGTYTNNGTLTVTTVTSGTGTLTQGANATLNNADNVWTPTLVATASGNTVNWNRAGAQTLEVPSGGYYNLELSGSNTKSSGGATIVLGNLTIGSGTTLDVTTGQDAWSVGGNWTNNGTFNGRAGTLTLNGTASQTIGGSATTTFYNLTVSNSSAAVSADTNFSVGVGGTLTVSAGAVLNPAAAVVISGAGTLTGNGTVNVTRTAATADLSSQYTITTKTLTNLTAAYVGSAAQTLSALTYGGLKINNANGVTLGGAATVNGVLTLTAGNLAVTDPNILTMGASATTVGATDVTGIVQRTSMVATTPYTFGNQYTTVTFDAGGTIPTDFSMKISIGSAPSWKTGAVQRTYDIIHTGGSGALTMALHYLDAELNGNTETKLVIWDAHLPTPPGDIDEHGRSNYDTTNNWVSCSSMSITYLATAFDSKVWALGDSALTPFTWTGATNTTWGYATNWTPAGVPSDLSDVVIPDATTTSNDPTLPASATISRITIESGGILNAAASGTLTLTGASGAWISNGTFNHSTSTVIFTNAAATLSGTTDFYNVTIDTGATLTLQTGSTMRIGGTMTNNGTWNAALLANTVEYHDGGSQTVVNPNGTTPGYYHLNLIEGGTKTLGAATTVAGTLTIGSGTTLDVSASNYALTVTGDWSNSGTFTARSGTITLNGSASQAIGGTTTTAFNNLTISNTSVAVSANTNFSVGGTLTVSASAVLNPAAAVIIGGSGTLTGNGTVNVTRTAATADFSSQYTISTKTLTNLTVAYTGSATQTLSALTYGSLKINNANGVTLGGDATVGGTLTFTSGNITTGGNSLIIASGGSVSRTSGHVVGNMVRAIDANGTVSRTFFVGTGADYAPISVTLSGVAGSASSGQTLTGSSTSGDHASIGASGIDSAKSVNRYWTLTRTGTWTFTSYDGTFNFVDGDKDGSANTANFIVRKYTSGTWSRPPGGVTTSANYTTGLAFTSFSDYVLGEAVPWESYEDSGRTTVRNTFTSSYTTVYMKGSSFSDVSYLIAYYDAGGTKRASETQSASGGTLNSADLLNTDPAAVAGTWHALVQPSSGYTAFGTASYDTITASPDTYGLLANDSFTVEAGAIPEFPAVAGAVVVAGMCFGVYWWLRKRRLGAVVRIQ